jgi:protein-tyrosine phosphatase
MSSAEMSPDVDEPGSEEARHVAFEACFNFRDLGGYENDEGRRVQWNLLYRSDTLHRLTAADVEQFDALGLRTVIDLRSVTEVDDYGRLATTSGHLAWHHVPMLDNVKLEPRDPAELTAALAQSQTQQPGEGYLRIVEEFGVSLALVFQLLSADDALPAVFHCTAGKDRTGIVAALLLEVLGVPDDVIAADYVLTERARARTTVWIEANEPGFAALMAQVPPERRVISAETILGLLEGVRSTYGSAAELLLSLGVEAKQLDALRTRLLEGERP